MQAQNGDRRHHRGLIRCEKILRARKKLHFMLIGNVKPYQQMTFISSPECIFGYEIEVPGHAQLEECQQQCSSDIDRMGVPT